MNSEIKNAIAHTINSHSEELRQISLQIHDHPELGEHEFNAYRILTEFLQQKGFHITHHAAGMETAFIAEYSNGTEGRRVGFCSEYDALPGVGHGCGHNLIAISGLACALAVKDLLEQNLVKGTVVLFGTPAEESTSGKITFVREQEVQKRVDFSMMLHPFAKDGMFAPFLALDSLKVEFFGKASHAGMAPWNGVNALDALMQAYDNIAMLRQQILPSSRIHGIIKDGGKSANVIPDYASGAFYVRSATRKQLAELKVKVEKCFQAAARGTGCEVKLAWAPNGPVEDVFQNEPMAAIYQQFMEEEGRQFPDRNEEMRQVSGSTDMGNFSYVTPTIHPMFGIHTDATNHTVEFAQAAGTEIAHKDTLCAARCLSQTAAAVLLDDALYNEAVKNFKQGKPE
ncbi:uncharacterized protein BYT42DRAFT_565892 [Radiomyces spectabilis]|uniref:uncharacterized protein n=1 Tax=Radiomyces spectabilis TaxID=64574 RepID=UPI00221EA544|nr:uncharacterized protein BYT42DRAFT_565892 [Radiomyces spectabilis]KAI8381265.1 hypothetical protein BYT42DRAFT_565892 [Radiomyces spectabilis]